MQQALLSLLPLSPSSVPPVIVCTWRSSYLRRWNWNVTVTDNHLHVSAAAASHHLPPLSQSHCTEPCPAASSRCTPRCPPVWCRCSHPSLRTTGSPWKWSPCRKACWSAQDKDDCQDEQSNSTSQRVKQSVSPPFLLKFPSRLSTSHFSTFLLHQQIL